MSKKAGRVLALLEALQDRPSATGPQLAARLGVDVRTIRRDVVTLQDLGIPVQAERGPAGGYRVAPGYRMPPLMLTAPEATVVTLGLIGARHDGLDAAGALDKVRRVLPDAVRRRVEALEATLRFTEPRAGGAPAPDADRLTALAEAALRGRRVHARYTTADGRATERELSPFGLVAHGGRWYVPAHDHGRAAPRTLRADRFGAIRLGEPGVAPPPGFDAVAFVTRTLARVPYAHEVEVVMHAPAAAIAQRFGPSLAELEPDGDDRTVVRLRADSLDWVAGLLAGAGWDFTVRRPDALRAALAALADRLRRA
jgi:predicted DNA-binding transcriptional regulator YafY